MTDSPTVLADVIDAPETEPATESAATDSVVTLLPVQKSARETTPPATSTAAGRQQLDP